MELSYSFGLPRIGFDYQRLAVSGAVYRELHGVVAGRHPLALRARRVLVNCGDRILSAAPAAARWRAVQVPDKTMHAGFGRKRLEWADPVGRHVQRRVRGRRFIAARKAPHQLAGAVENL